ncbi:MAG: potassium channel family protein [Syntrophobacterales bacterium]
MLKKIIVDIIRTLQRERVFALASFIAILVFLGGLGYLLTEALESPNLLHQFGQGLWWALVTITTVGYGDITPKTTAGRLVGAALMVGGLVSFSLVTATVASIFIERKFRRERGLETVKATNHILILGWHYDGETLLDQLVRRLPPTAPVVLVNQLTPEKMDNIRAKYPENEPLFVWGDYSREEVLLRANVRFAFKAIILAGRQEEESAAEVDQRTLITALTLKSLHPKIKILAELLRPDNKSYLERAGAEQILVRGQYDSSILAGAIASPGLFQVLDSLLNAEGYTVWAVEVPFGFQGRSVKDLADYLKEQYQALLIAIYSEGRPLSMEDLLGDEPSAIDDFIRSKFAETGMAYLFGRTKMEFQINPPETQVLGPQHRVVVIAAQPPKF